MDEAALLLSYLVVGGLLFGIGLVGLLARRNLIVMFLSVELALQGVALSLVGWSRYHNDFGGQMLVIFIIAVAAAEAAVALALFTTLFGRAGNLDVATWRNLREASAEPVVATEAGDPPPPPAWPKLSPAGAEPAHDPDETRYRSHV